MPLVLWSGGADSTLVLHNLLKEQKQKIDNRFPVDDMVRTISINHCQVPANAQSKRARIKMIEWFKRKGFQFEHTEIEINNLQGSSAGGTEGGGLIQPLIWLNAVYYLNKKEDLYCGYIKGDDLWHFYRSFYDAFWHLQYVRANEGKMYNPLEWTSKKEVIQDLRNCGLINKVWYCEGSLPDDATKPCKTCSSCLTHKYAEMMLEEEAKGVKKIAGVMVKPAKAKGLRKVKVKDEAPVPVEPDIADYDVLDSTPLKSLRRKSDSIGRVGTPVCPDDADAIAADTRPAVRLGSRGKNYEPKRKESRSQKRIVSSLRKMCKMLERTTKEIKRHQ